MARRLPAALAAAFALCSLDAAANVFGDAYQCVKANAKLLQVSAEIGPGAIEFVVTQPQCVAAVLSPAPVPVGVMAGTLGLTATGVLPKKNPGCEGALYSTAAKPIAKILDSVGLLPSSINKQIASGASNEAIGAAVQAIPGSGIALGSFSCGCGLSSAGLNPGTVKEVYAAINATASKCGAIFTNLVAGGLEGLNTGISNLGDVLAGQAKHVDPQVYYKAFFAPRLRADWKRFSTFVGLLEQELLYKGPIYQCTKYFDSHTMSEVNAQSTCSTLANQYMAEYERKIPAMQEADMMLRLLSRESPPPFGFLTPAAAPMGTHCSALSAKAYPGTAPASSPVTRHFQEACMGEAAAYFGYSFKRDAAYSSSERYLIQKVSNARWQDELAKQAADPKGRNSAQLQQDVTKLLLDQWIAATKGKEAQWKAQADSAGAAQDAKNKAAAEKSAAELKKKDAENKAAADKAAADGLAKLQAPCKDERCRTEVAAYRTACRPKGTEGQQMNGQIHCDLNIGVLYNFSARRVDFQAKLEAQVRKVLAVICPPTMDCATGVAKQRVQIEAEAARVWDYVRDESQKRGTVDGAGKAIATEATAMLAPVLQRQVVAAPLPKAFAADPAPAKVPPALAPPPPVLVAPPPSPVKPGTAAPPVPAHLPPPVVKPPAPPAVSNLPPPSAKNPLGGPALAGAGSGVAGCSARSERESDQLVCENDAALNRCRSLLATGKVKRCELRR